MQNMKNSLALFTFFRFDWTYLFWANFVKKVKFFNLFRNSVYAKTNFEYAELNGDVPFLRFSTGKAFLKQIWSEKLNCQLSWNLAPEFPLGTGMIPQTTQKIDLSPACLFTVLAQKCWSCNFHTVFCHFAQILPGCGPQVRTLRT